MARKVTAVEVSYDKIIESGIEVGSTDWFQWLEESRSFHYTCSQGHFTANKNSKGYWYAQRRSEAKLLQHYMGQSQKLTLETLKEAASKLSLAVIDNRPHNRLERALEEQSCKSCMTDEERLRQFSKEELIELVAHLKNQLHDYKTVPGTSSQAQEEIANLKALVEARGRERDQLANLMAGRDERHSHEMQSVLQRIEQLQSENQILKKQLSECSLQELNKYLGEIGGIPLDDKGKPKARYDQLAKFRTWLETHQG